MQVIWDAYKATIRGNLIAINSNKKQKDKAKLKEIQAEEPKENIKQILNAEISEEEVMKAITELKSNKALGPGGFSATFFKIMKEDVSKILATLMNEIIRMKEIRNTWKEANITLLPKDGMDLKDPKNYRPISLLNRL